MDCTKSNIPDAERQLPNMQCRVRSVIPIWILQARRKNGKAFADDFDVETVRRYFKFQFYIFFPDLHICVCFAEEALLSTMGQRGRVWWENGFIFSRMQFHFIIRFGVNSLILTSTIHYDHEG